MMLTRMVSSSTAAVVVTGGLLLLMAGLIAQHELPRLSTYRPTFVPHVREPRPPERIERRRPPEPQPVREPPPRPRTGGAETGLPVLDPTPHPPAPPGRGDPRGPAISDGDLLPIVTVAPHYPPSAASRELEGYVIVTFTVAANGSVEQVRVSESTHKIFERAAIEAARKFRFRPRIIDGKPVAVEGVRRRITFVLEK